jgi:hypothetical protein
MLRYGRASNFQCYVNDSEGHDPHSVRMLTVMRVEKIDEDSEEFPD